MQRRRMSQSLEFEFIADGVTRPEGVAEASDGSIWVSDKAGAAAQVLPGGGIRQVGQAGGEPNSLNFLPDGRLLIANFEGTLQVLDTGTGAIETLISEVDGVTITHSNYALADADGYVWATESTRSPTLAPRPSRRCWRTSTDGFSCAGPTAVRRSWPRVSRSQTGWPSPP